MARKGSETAKLERDLGKLIDSIDLPDHQKQFLRSRWLDQVLWMERAAGRARLRYYTFRLFTVLGAVVIPAMLSLNLTGDAETAVKWATFAISLLVAASAAIDGLLPFRHTLASLPRDCRATEVRRLELCGAQRPVPPAERSPPRVPFPTSSLAWSRLSVRRSRTTWRESPAPKPREE